MINRLRRDYLRDALILSFPALFREHVFVHTHKLMRDIDFARQCLARILLRTFKIRTEPSLQIRRDVSARDQPRDGIILLSLKVRRPWDATVHGPSFANEASEKEVHPLGVGIKLSH